VSEPKCPVCGRKAELLLYPNVGFCLKHVPENVWQRLESMEDRTIGRKSIELATEYLSALKEEFSGLEWKVEVCYNLEVGEHIQIMAFSDDGTEYAECYFAEERYPTIEEVLGNAEYQLSDVSKVCGICEINDAFGFCTDLGDWVCQQCCADECPNMKGCPVWEVEE